MENNMAILFKNVAKSYPLLYQKTIKEFFQALFTRKKTIEKIEALKNINLSIKKGERLG
jgi:ABC-type polysaccharide/polyol phosphate transport system, ATPase component